MYLSNRYKSENDGYTRENDNTTGVIVVDVVKPQSYRENLKHIKGREDLAKKHDKYWRQMNAY
jgi:hypothetical protein